MKCPVCKGCLEYVRVNGEQLLYCWLCKRYYRAWNQTVVDVTEVLREDGLIE
jgi:hypothetical protein